MKIISVRHLNDAGAVEIKLTGGVTFIDDRARPAPASIRALLDEWRAKNTPEPYAIPDLNPEPKAVTDDA